MKVFRCVNNVVNKKFFSDSRGYRAGGLDKSQMSGYITSIGVYGKI